MKLKLAGLRRKKEFSPNHVENDFLIINATADILQQMGAEITWYEEGEINPDSIREDLMFSMVQGPVSIAILEEITKRRPVLIINSAQSVWNCYRTQQVKLLPHNQIPFPKSVILKTTSEKIIGQEMENLGSEKLWLKRGDVHAVKKEDVSQITSQNEAVALLHQFSQRGITHAVLQEHLEGDTVKFYAVRGSEFFYWYYQNGKSNIPFPQSRLKELAHLSAEVLGLHVYGGDAIIEADGSIKIIDINDWPSFAPIRKEAASEIAKVIFRKAEDFSNGRK